MSTQSLRFTCAGKPAPGNVASAGSGRLFPDRHRMQYWRSSNEDSEASGPRKLIRGLTLPGPFHAASQQ